MQNNCHQSKPINQLSYVRRFSPRKAGGIWSKTNRSIAEKLLADGKITTYGMAKIEEAKKSGKWQEAYDMQLITEIPDDLRKALKVNSEAWHNFNKFTNSYQSRYIYYINRAKRKETREKRIRMVVENAQNNIKPTMS